MLQPVRTLALLREDGFRRLMQRKPVWCELSGSAVVPKIVMALDARQCDVLVLDPGAVQSEALDVVVTAATRASVGMLLYSWCDPASVAPALHIFGVAMPDLLWMGVDDESNMLAKRLQMLAHPSAPALALGKMASRVRQLPEVLELRVMGLFGWMPLPESVGEFLKLGDQSERTWRRDLAAAGLARPRDQLVGARLLRTWENVARGDRAGVIARRYGYPSEKTFHNQWDRFVGISQRKARVKLDIEQFAQRIARRLCRLADE